MNDNKSAFYSREYDRKIKQTLPYYDDFYEQVIEADLEHLQSVQVSLTNAGTLRFSLYLCCKSDLSALADRPGVRYESEGEDDYQCILFFPEGGAP